MDTTNQFFTEHLDFVFFVYGLAFISMGIAVYAQPKKGSEFKIANVLWLLALFGIIHGLNEHLDMWAIIRGRGAGLDSVRWFILLISYVFLFEFGRRLFRLITGDSPAWHKMIANALDWWLLPVVVLVVIINSLMSADFWKTGSIWIRYLLGFPGSALIGSGLLLYYRVERKSLETLKVKKFFSYAGMAFLAYGVLGGLVVPDGGFFPSSWLNTDSFDSAFRIPVQVFRAFCAIVILIGISGMLRIFNWEFSEKLAEAQGILKKLLEETERRYADITENALDMIYCIDTDGSIIFENVRGYEVPGYLKGEIIGKEIYDMITLDSREMFKRSLKRLGEDGSLFIDDIKIIRKDGKKLDVEIHLLATYDDSKNFIGATITVRDISERKKLENELRTRVKELEDFHDMAIGRELKMIALKEEIENLKKERRENRA